MIEMFIVNLMHIHIYSYSFQFYININEYDLRKYIFSSSTSKKETSSELLVSNG